MNDPWFRMHANIADKPVVWRLASALHISHAKAIGHLAMFWGKVSQHAPHGDVGAIIDSQLEAWAGWEGKRGAFAAWLRADHLTDGHVNEYEEYSGKLEERREKDRQRKAAQKAHADMRGIPADDARNSDGIPAERRRNSSATRRDDTKRDVTTASSPHPRGRAAMFAAGVVTRFPDALQSDVEQLFERCPDAALWAAECTAWLDGVRSPQLTPEQLAGAVHDYLANGEEFAIRLFRGYLRNAGQPVSPPNGRRARGDRANAGAQGYANALAALEDVP